MPQHSIQRLTRNVLCVMGGLYYCLSVCLFYFGTHGHIPTARSGPSLAAAVSALPLPQPSSPPATMWAPGRPPPSWGPSVQQIGIWAIGPYPSTRKTSSWQHADVGLLWDVREAALAYPHSEEPHASTSIV